MHELLERQLKEHFGSLEDLPESLRPLVEVLDQAYQQTDVDRQLLESSLSVTSQKLLTTNAELRSDAAELEERVKERTAELRDSEQRYQILAENSPTGIFHAGVDGRMLYVNKKWSEITGLSPDEVVGQPWTAPLTPRPGQERQDEAERAGSETGALNGREFLIERLDGQRVWVVGHAAALRDVQGKTTGYVGTVTDITDRKLAEEAIRRSEEKYRALFEGSRDTIYISTPQGEVVDVNPAGVELLGYSSKEEVLKLDINEHIYVHTEDRTRLLEAITQHGFIKDVELDFKRKSGEQLTVLVTASVVRGENGEVVAIRGIIRDVTEQRQLERQLRQVQKMEAVGRLAGGVAHDFNNLLTAIIGHADLVAISTSPDDPIYEHSQEIIAAARKGGELTRELLALSRRQAWSPKVLNLNQVVDEVQSLLSRVIGGHIELVSEPDPNLALVRADPSHLEQVILNLAINARDAMPDGGTLTLRTFNTTVAGPDSLRRIGMSPGSYVVLATQDTGVGIAEEIQDRVFEPFFTTKGGERGSGLGLATVYAIVQQCGGSIDFRSAPGQGTCFEIYFPQVEADSDTTVHGPPAVAAASRETILLVEDESAVRIALEQILKRQGYEVLTASDGAEGLDLARQNVDAIDLLVSDVVMPRMNGIELARQLKTEQPEIKILLISGYTDEDNLVEALPNQPLSFLQKPFSTQLLGNTVREILSPSSDEATTRLAESM